MTWPVELVLAYRYLAMRRRATAITFLTWASIAGVTIGVAALVIVLAVMNGFQTELESRIVGTNAHVYLLPPADVSTLEGSDSLMARALRQPDVVACAPFVFGKAMIASETSVDGIAIKGVDLAREPQVTQVLQSVTPVVGDSLHGILLGVQLAAQLDVKVGDLVTLTAPSSPVEVMMGLVRPQVVTVPVAGLVTTGLYEFDSSLGFLSLHAAQDFFGLGDGVSGISVRIRDLYAAQQESQRLLQALGGDLRSANWIEQNRNLYVWMRTEKVMMFCILSLIILVATFNIASSLSMAVIEKRRDIGILRTMGGTGPMVLRTFLAMGAVIGVLGTGVGTVLGLAGAWALKRWDIVRLPSDVYFVNHLPVRLEASDVAWVTLAALALCVLATVPPAWQASRLTPVDAIRTAE